MLTLELRFESSWSNKLFADDHRTPLFTSQKQLNTSARKLIGVPAQDIAFDKGRPRHDYLRALNQANPRLLYRVPETYGPTVQGVLARLVGEVRRVTDLRETEPDHLALRAFAAGEFAITIEAEHSSTTTLTTYRGNPVQSGGAGVMPESVLYGDTTQSRYLFGHLEFTLLQLQERLINGDPLTGSWYPQSPSALIERLTMLANEQAAKIKRAKNDDNAPTYRSPFTPMFELLARQLPEDARAQMAKATAPATTVATGALDPWPIAGALVVANVNAFDPLQRVEYEASGALTKKGNLAGFAMSGNVGRVTAKDLFAFATGTRAISHRMPYTVDLPIIAVDGKTMLWPSGVLKKTGTLRFTLDKDQTLEKELRDAVLHASVGPLHFGKKGVAYVTRLEQYG